MLLKVDYALTDVRPHPCLHHYFNCFDDKGQLLQRVQEFDTETLVGKLSNGTAVNVTRFGWFPPDQAAYEELLHYLPRGYHHLIQIRQVDACAAQA